MDYLQKIKQLPPPTEEQITQFTEHVADAHSCYKHLPLTPAKPFYFYLDPNAGRATAYGATGDPTFFDITDPKDCVHYSSMLTSVYRQRFGFWSYDAQIPQLPQATTRGDSPGFARCVTSAPSFSKLQFVSGRVASVYRKRSGAR